jgi:hypothetical protein
LVVDISEVGISEVDVAKFLLFRFEALMFFSLAVMSKEVAGKFSAAMVKTLPDNAFGAGMPDFSWYKIPKREKLYQICDHKIYQMTVK